MSQSDLPALENIISPKEHFSHSNFWTCYGSLFSIFSERLLEVKLLRNHFPRLEMQARDVKKDTLQLENSAELTKRLVDSW